ncbi:MAG: hypothetical protein RJA34_869 [Pseudomonadota bacterium]
MAQEENVRSVERALQVMRTLQELQAASLATLHHRTGLAKPTLTRLLYTLEQQQTVWRARGDGLWRPAFEFKPTRILRATDLALMTAALPVMERLRQKVVWPSDLAVRDGTHMRLLETTRRASRLDLNHDQIGYQIDMLRSAVGRAYLAYCPLREKAQLTRQLAKLHGRTVAQIEEELASIDLNVRSRAYAERDGSFGGHAEPVSEFDDQLAAISVPILSGVSVLGALNLVWLKRFDAKKSIIDRHLAELTAAANEIALAVAS